LTPIVVHVTGASEPRSVHISVDTAFGKLSTTVDIPGVESDLTTTSGTTTSSDESSDESASETTS
jgi:hypothetical protein